MAKDLKKTGRKIAKQRKNNELVSYLCKKWFVHIIEFMSYFEVNYVAKVRILNIIRIFVL